MMNLALTLRPNHYVVTVGEGKRKRVVFGYTLPLSKRAAIQFALRNVAGNYSVIMRKTATRAGIL